MTMMTIMIHDLLTLQSWDFGVSKLGRTCLAKLLIETLMVKKHEGETDW